MTLIYSIGEAGRARDITATGVAYAALMDGAVAILGERRYAVPMDWKKAGGATKRYRLDVIFNLSGAPQISPVEGVQDTVVVSAHSIPGGPAR